jgi:hypothetical protein
MTGCLPQKPVRRLAHAHIRVPNTPLTLIHFIPGLWHEAAQMNNTRSLSFKIN